MGAWPDNLTRMLGVSIPVIQAPMAGIDTPELALAVAKAGGLGSIGCALRAPDTIHETYASVRAQTDRPINLNFFCHDQKPDSPEQQERWKNRLLSYYAEYGLDPNTVPPAPVRAPFDETFCSVVEAIKPHVVSFHFGLPSQNLLDRVKNTGAIIMSSATTGDEARWLEDHGANIVIAQGTQAGGHRGMFLTSDVSTQIETEKLLPAIVESVSVPVVAAGGIASAVDIQRAFALGASAVQLGTAYLFCPEIKMSSLYRQALHGDGQTTLTNLFSGRPARGIVNRFIEEVGPLSPDAPAFPFAAQFVNPLRQASEKQGSTDCMQMWSGAVRRPHTQGAESFTRALWEAFLRLK